MVDRIVIDASVAVAYLGDEVGTESARAAIVAWTAASAELLVPSHFWLEVTNALGRGQARAADDVIEGLVILDGLSLQTIETDRPLLLMAIGQMARTGLSAYDSMYLALGLSSGSLLATFDRRLAEAAEDAGVLLGQEKHGRVSERRDAYRPDPTRTAAWAHSAVVGAHIAALRRRTLASPQAGPD